ncbi:MAG: Bax inhibitor-1 family protein [Coprobacillus sp.]|nr:Bax inhibitor-1 family protein [Coprobacillus sp.]
MPSPRDYDENGNLKNDNVIDNDYALKQNKRTVSETTYTMAKIFLYMFILLLISAGVSLLVGYGFYSWSLTNPNAANGWMIGVLVVSAIVQLVLCFMINRSVRRGRAMRTNVLAIVYAVVMGLMLSSFTAWIDWEVLGITFGFTALIFLLMAGISAIGKGRFERGVGTCAMGLIVGGLIIGLVAMFIAIFGSWEAYYTTYTILMAVLFVAMMLISLVDINRVKRIVNQGNATGSMSFYLAFILYTDYICVFIYLLQFLLRIFGRRR